MVRRKYFIFLAFSNRNEKKVNGFSTVTGEESQQKSRRLQAIDEGVFTPWRDQGASAATNAEI